MKTIILISGKQGAGKTTLAKNLCHHIKDLGKDYYPHRIKFADVLYDMHALIRGVLQAYKIDNMPADQIDGPLLQVLGTEWGRKTRGENFWADVAKARVEALYQMHCKHKMFHRYFFIFDDCRFENEVRAWDRDEDPDLRVVKIHLTADQEKRKVRAEKWRENVTHPSETGLDGYYDYDLNVNTNERTGAETVKLALETISLIGI